jgi:hypothetical protein
MDYRKKFFVDPAEKLRLRKLDPSYKGDHESEEAFLTTIGPCRTGRSRPRWCWRIHH